MFSSRFSSKKKVGLEPFDGEVAMVCFEYLTKYRALYLNFSFNNQVSHYISNDCNKVILELKEVTQLVRTFCVSCRTSIVIGMMLIFSGYSFCFRLPGN